VKNYQHKSRQQRKSIYIRNKNAIARACAKTGAHFSTYDILDGAQWADIMFIGSHRDVYSATVLTTRCAWHDAVEAQAFDNVWKKLSEKEKDNVDVPFMSSLNNQNFYHCVDEEEISIQKEIYIHAGFELLKDFTYAIGINIIIDTDELNISIINDAIARFIAQGEKAGFEEQALQYDYDRKFRYSTNPLNLEDV
jgi:hypothetical protein